MISTCSAGEPATSHPDLVRKVWGLIRNPLRRDRATNMPCLGHFCNGVLLMPLQNGLFVQQYHCQDAFVLGKHIVAERQNLLHSLSGWDVACCTVEHQPQADIGLARVLKLQWCAGSRQASANQPFKACIRLPGLLCKLLGSCCQHILWQGQRPVAVEAVRVFFRLLCWLICTTDKHRLPEGI